MFYVHKLGKPIIISGIGVHSGEKTTIELSPIDEDKIIFYNKYTDCFIELKHEYVKNFNSTSLISGKCRFHTIEHLMAVIYILQIKGIIIETDSEEIPILDGSGKMFWEKIKKAVISTGKSSDFIKIDKNIIIEDEKGGIASVKPSEKFIIDYTIEFNHPLIGKQSYIIELSPEVFENDIVAARTFGFIKDAKSLREKGLALGSSYKNTIVLDDYKIINPPLRFKNEFVRHKILDLIGDLSFIRAPVKGYFKIFKGGHRLHKLLTDKILKNHII
jgi:UDP-3-O-[3-hydroxymyristoyl] N-acetylglucosamine deacetylase